MQKETIAVVGLGYCGLPLAVALSKHFHVVGYDIDQLRLEELDLGIDITGEISRDDLRATTIEYTTDLTHCAAPTFYIVTVPTPINKDKTPDLGPLKRACYNIAASINDRNDVVVCFESTVYPGCTRRKCGSWIQEWISRSRFKLAYSPERINPGDKEHTVSNVTKIVSAEDRETLDRVEHVYGTALDAPLHRAPTIEVAEAAKVLENTQRDVNIALMNECSQIFDRLDIDTKAVLDAAGTKWNFGKYTPGLVGGHCVSVDPYYLAARAVEVGYHPDMILAGRRTNDSMPEFIANKTIKLLCEHDLDCIKDCSIGILGATFKPNVPDTRNSLVPKIRIALQEYNPFHVSVLDPLKGGDGGRRVDGYNAMIYAVPHDEYQAMGLDILEGLDKGGIVIDICRALNPAAVLEAGYIYWGL